jgi:hypothetical protein
MLEYRVTKYDPQFRDVTGAYSRREWTSYRDVGGSVSLDDYLTVEATYVRVAIALLIEADIGSLQVRGFENAGNKPVAYAEGSLLARTEWEYAFRSVLREQFWCRFESPESFVHFGWDYYMYVGVPRHCPTGVPRI